MTAARNGRGATRARRGGGIIGSLDLYDRLDQVRSGGQGAVRNVTIQLLNDDCTAVAERGRSCARANGETRERPLRRSLQRRRGEELTLADERLELE